MKSRQLQSTVPIGVVLLMAFIFAMLAQTADHPLVAAGIGLQTLAGLFAAVQLWANNASNTLLRWAANQIDSNRWHVAGLLDGRRRSLLIATAWGGGGFLSLRLPDVLEPPAVVGWPLAIAVSAFALAGVIALFLALFMCTSAYLLDGKPVPDGEASTALEARLAANDWIWPFVALAFLAGGIMQVVAA